MELNLTIAGLTGHIVCPDGAFADQLRASAYGGYANDGNPSLHFEVILSPTAGLPGAGRTDDTVVVTVEDDRLQMIWRDGEAQFDRRARAGELRVRPMMPAFTTGLRAALAFVLPDFDGFLLHSCGVLRRGRACLFFGPSGSGKTTVAGLSADPVLSDDTIGIRVRGREAWAFATPFRGDFNRPPSAPPPEAPVAAAFHLIQAADMAAERLNRSEAVRRLSQCLMFDLDDAEYRRRLMEQAMAFSAAVPCHALRFTPTPDLWSVVDGAEV